MAALFAGWLLAAPLAAQDDAPPARLEEFSTEAEGGPGAGGTTESTVQKEVRKILAQPDYRRMRVEKAEVREYDAPKWQWPQWLKDFLRWLGQFFRPLGGLFSGLGAGLPVAAWAALIFIFLVILYLILRVLAAYQRRWSASTVTSIRKTVEEGEAGLNPGDVAADVHLAHAQQHAARGEFREAIGCLLLGAMSHAERAAWIRHRRGLTHRDYLRAMRGKQDPHSGFKTILGIYEPICFGRRDAYREHFDVSLEGYQQGFGRMEVGSKTLK
jgi:hypothetical protein